MFFGSTPNIMGLILGMKNKELFSLGLGLKSPWQIASSKLEGGQKSKGIFQIHHDYPKGSKFEYEGQLHSVFDHQECHSNWHSMVGIYTL